MWVLQGMAAIVGEENRRQWTSLSMEQRRMLTTPVKKEPGNKWGGKRSWVEVGRRMPELLVRRTLLHLLVPNERNLSDRVAKARDMHKN